MKPYVLIRISISRYFCLLTSAASELLRLDLVWALQASELVVPRVELWSDRGDINDLPFGSFE